MSPERAVRRFLEDVERSGRPGECEIGWHHLCHPQDVYASDRPGPGEEPVFSIRCACACHQDA
ncbi:hypothetical protein I3F58_02485 [Streptomyces sp. MUM 203J]|uniref:hypothetical protein n=1 Tax=Streptomyces sp. MUM 203J TaxID=2791990 RepID=UPI001F03B3EE|nr:hypothetical protein [Streptomyces sp. MUM 203J]MCH0538446.1 hypothetical protein [Streptomyces sp. MUM 203J]